MTQLYGIYGTGGCARGIMPLVVSERVSNGSDYCLVFIDDQPSAATCNGFSVVTLAQFLAIPVAHKYVAIAIANPAVRQGLAVRCLAQGLSFFDVRAAQVVEMDDVLIGAGALISPYVVFTSNIRIGCHFQINHHSYVEHDTVIGDFVTFAPGVRCNGNVTIGDGAYVGSGATIRQGINIGAGATIGMGAVVVKDVEDFTTVVGNPARPLIR